MKKLMSVLLFAMFATYFAGTARAQVIVIANPQVSGDSVSKAELREIFLGSATSGKDVGHVAPVLLKEGSTHSEFVSSYLGASQVALLVTWRGLVLSGQATMPKTFDSEAAMVEYVARTPRALGYINKSTPHDGVKVLAVH